VDIVYGRNPVIEALKAGRARKVLLTGGLKDIEFVQLVKELATKMDVPVALATKEDLLKLASKAVHQGIVAYVESLTTASLDTLLTSVKDRSDVVLVLLDGVIDPQNLGSLLRSSHAAGASGIIVRAKRSVGLTPAAVKASAGAAEYVPVVSVPNLTYAIERLKRSGYWIIGASEKAEKKYFDADLTGKIVIVLGSEGKGISRLVAEKCDWSVEIPMKGRISSLNVAVAGAVLLFEAVRQRIQGPGSSG
jgi:23S rRNA (guanosine2251-2'-O)-methyltransferase